MKIYTLVMKDDDYSCVSYLTREAAEKQMELMNIKGESVIGILDNDLHYFPDELNGAVEIFGTYTPSTDKLHIEFTRSTSRKPFGPVVSDGNLTIPKHYNINLVICTDGEDNIRSLYRRCHKICQEYFMGKTEEYK